MTTSFSVVIPAYNAQATVAATVRSALAQTVSGVEVIVVDDGSTDGTRGAVEALDDPRVQVLGQDNKGPAAARNAGIAAARGRQVAFLDSDDLWMPRFLELAAEALERVENPGFAYTDAYAFDASSGRVRQQTAMEWMGPPTPPPTDRGQFLLELLARNFVFVSTVVPRRVLDDVGGYDERLSGTADYELWLRIVIAGYDPAWVQGEHALYRLHAGQMHGDARRMYGDLLATYEKLDPDALPTDAHRDVLGRRKREIERELRAVRGEDPLLSTVRAFKQRALRVRDRLGGGPRWRERPPDAVAEAFGDLASL